METKTCTKCGVEKPATTEYFHKDRCSPSGLRSDCKVCMSAWKKLWGKQYRQDPANKEKRAAYREKNKEKIAAYSKQYYQENKEKIAACNKQHYQGLPAGVYKILNKETERIYIGASTGLPKRWSDHKLLLCKGDHRNQNMQEDYNKFGLDAFEFKIIEEYPPDTQLKTLEKREQEEIRKRLSEGKNLYNIFHGKLPHRR